MTIICATCKLDLDSCPTCGKPWSESRCDHRKSVSAHAAFVDGQRAYLVAWSNGEREPNPPPNPHPGGSDEACWWVRGFHGAAAWCRPRIVGSKEYTARRDA